LGNNEKDNKRVGRLPYLTPFGRRLFVTFALTASLLVTIIGFIGYWQSRKSVLENAERRLNLIAHDRAHEVANWMRERKREITLLSQLPEVETLLDGQFIGRTDSLELVELFKLFNLTFRGYSPCGIGSVEGEPLILFQDKICGMRSAELQLAIRESLRNREAEFSEVDTTTANYPIVWLVKGIPGTSGELHAVLVFSIQPAIAIYPFLEDSSGLGETGVTFLLTKPGERLSPSLPSSRSVTAIRYLPQTKGSIYLNERGQMVIGSDIHLKELGWIVRSEMNLTEALKPINRIIGELLLVGAVAILVILMLSAIISRQLTIPLNHLSRASDSISKGHFDLTIPRTGTDELKVLTRQFQTMASSLKKSREELEVSTHQLIHAEKLAVIGKLVASIVHEMRNPLSAIKMNLRILEKKADLDEMGVTHLSIAKEQSERLERMLNELLEYSKPVKPQFATVNLKSLLLQTKMEFNTQMAEKNISINASFPETAVDVNSDPDLLSRIFDNLISNAIAASQPDTAIDVKVEEAEGEVRLTFQDAGKGMSQKVLDQIFEPFFTTRGDGVGLGLSNVKKFVEALHAEIDVQSDEGKGTTFTIKIPHDDQNIGNR